MSKNKAHDPFVGSVKQLQKEQGEHHSNYYRGRHRVVMFDDKISALTLTSASTVTWTDLDVTAHVSADTIAVIVLLQVNDSGSAATNALIQVRPNGSVDTVGHVVATAGYINDQIIYAQGICKVDTDKILEYQRTASGAGTLDAKIEVVGYIEQLS